MKVLKPNNKPKNPRFCVGPTAKHHNYSLSNLDESFLGRSHRSQKSSQLLGQVIKDFKSLLKVPDSYKVILTPASNTGALEAALWNIAGSNNIDCLAWDAFGYLWADDLQTQMKLDNLRVFHAPYGEYPDTSNVDWKNNDIIFTYCGTTSGITFQDVDKIPVDRKGVVISDATSHLLSEDIPWDKIDVLTLSWQKCLGGEAQNGLLILSPRAIERINNYTPKWGIPQIFRIKENGLIKEDLLDTGSPLNTLSMLTVVDVADALNWIKQNGGSSFCYKKVAKNYSIIKNWIDNSPNVTYLASNSKYSSKLSVCIKIIKPEFLQLSQEKQKEALDKMFNYFEVNEIAYDIASYRKAPLGIRIWAGATIDASDLEILTQWLEWGLQEFI